MNDKNTILRNHIREQIHVKKIDLQSLEVELKNKVKKVDETKLLIQALEDELSKLGGGEVLKEMNQESLGKKSDLVLAALMGEYGEGLLIKEIVAKAKRDQGQSISYKYAERVLESLIEKGEVEQTNPGFSRNKRYRQVMPPF